MLDSSLTQIEMNRRFAYIPAGISSGYHSSIGAALNGSLILNHRVGIRATMVDGGHSVCLDVTEVQLSFTLRPVIYLALEARQKDCAFRAFLAHELEHIGQDRLLLEEYRMKFPRFLSFAIGKEGDSRIGPIPASLQVQATAELRARVEGAIGNIFSLMKQNRLMRHAGIDTEAEYVSLGRACQPRLKHQHSP